MPRIRSVKPEFFTHEGLGELSAAHRLAFAGLWCHADREGRLEDRPARLKLGILPYDEAVDFHALLNDLAEAGFIVRYKAGDGEKYIAIPTFREHQRPHPKEPPSKIPPPEPSQVPESSPDERGPGEPRRATAGPGPDAARSAPAASTSRQGTSEPVPSPAGKGKGNGDPPLSLASLGTSPLPGGTDEPRSGKDAPVRRRGTRVPEPFPLDEALERFCAGYELHGASLDAVVAEFVDYWRSVPGQRGVKLDWPATFRNRVRDLAAQGRLSTGGTIHGRVDGYDPDRFRETMPAAIEVPEGTPGAVPVQGAWILEVGPDDPRHPSRRRGRDPGPG